MKKIKHILIAAILTAGGFLAGCTSIADELTELSLTRCLEPLNLEYTISDGDSVVFNWDLVTGSDQFALQIAENSGTFETEDGKLTSSVIHDLVIKADQVPFGIKLTADQEYYFRVQAQTSANDKEPSKWAVYADPIATYAVRSSLFPEVTGRTATSITLSWNEDPEVTHILCTPREGTPVRYDLSEDEVKAHTATVSNLTASTNYTVGLYYMSANRGELSLYTMPDLSGIAPVSTVEDLKQAFTDKASKVVVSMAGSPYELGSVELIADMELYGEEAADGTRPVIHGSVSIAGAETIGRFLSQGIEWNGNDGSTGRHVQMKSGNITDVTYRNCTITGYSDGLFYNNAGGTVSSVTYEGCDIYDIPGSGGDGFDFRKGSLGNVNFINNTIYNSFRTFMRIDKDVTISGKIIVRNNTFMGVSTFDNSNNRGVIGIQATSASGKIEFSSNLFLHMESISTMSKHNKNLPASSFTFSNNHFFDVNEEFFNDQCTEANATAGGGSVLAADPCFNSAGMNFHLTNSTLLNAKVGDPRWFVAYVEPPIDNNLTLITGAKTWDLSDASIFSGELKKTQVKDQLRFIVDDEHSVRLENGLIKFSAAADVSRAGVPNSGALEFIVNKSGSLIIEAANTGDETANNSNHIVVSLGGTVKGGAAVNVDMGTPQKIVIAGIEEQSSIYLYPSGPIAIKTLAWSNDVSPVNTALPTPEVTAAPNSVGEQAEPVVVTWAPVPGAASYSFSFGSISEEVTGTEYTIPADAFAVLSSGGYPVSVIANPAEGDIYNTASAAGTAVISVVKGGSGTPVVSTLDEAFEYLKAGQPVQLAAGTYNFAGSGIDGMSDGGVYTITNNFDLSAEESAEVTIIGGFKLGAGAGNISLDGISFSGNNEAIDNFLEDVEGETNATSITIKNCVLTGYKKSIIYNSKENSAIGDLVISNNLIHDNGDGQGTFDFRKGTLANLTVQNNVIANGSRDIVRADEAVTGTNSIIISNNTFYNITGGNSNGFARIRATVTEGITISKNVFVNMLSTNYPFVHSNTMEKNTVPVDHNFFYNFDDEWFSDMDQTTATANGGAVLSADPLPNAASGNFTVTGEAATAGAGATWPK